MMSSSLRNRGSGPLFLKSSSDARRMRSHFRARRAQRLPDPVAASGFKLPELPEFRNPLDALREGTVKLGTGTKSTSRAPAGAAKDVVFVAGSSGRLGIRIVYELAAAGYRVRAGVRSQDKADAFDEELASLSASIGEALDKKARSNINLVYCDLQDEESIKPAIGNASRVICAVGAAESEFTNLSAPKLIDFEATQALIDVAASCNVKQFILVTSLGTGKLGFPAGVLNLFGGILVWKRKAEEALEQSGMQYLIVRPGGMERPTDNHRAMGYNVRLAKRDTLFGGTVSRLQVAELVTAAVGSPEMACNKCIEVVAELKAPEVAYEELLDGMPVEVDQAAREAALGTIEELVTREGQLEAKITALSSELSETRDFIAELQQEIKEARTEEKGIVKENTEVLMAAQRAEAEIESLRELVEEQKLLAEASKAVAAAQQKGLASGVVLSPQEIASIRESILFPPVEEEETDAETTPKSKASVAKGSFFSGFALPGLPKAGVEEVEEEKQEEVVEAPVVAQKAKTNDLFGNLVGFLEGDARRGGQDLVDEKDATETDERSATLPPVPDAGPVPEKAAENTGILGGFRIRNMFGGGDYAFIDELEGQGEADEVESKPEVAVATEAMTVGPTPAVEESNAEIVAEQVEEVIEEVIEEVPMEDSIEDIVVEEVTAKESSAKSIFPSIGDVFRPPSIEMPKLPSFEMPKVSSSSTVSEADSNVEEVRQWIAAWKERSPGVSPEADAGDVTETAEVDVDSNVLEVRGWIANWRERTN